MDQAEVSADRRGHTAWPEKQDAADGLVYSRQEEVGLCAGGPVGQDSVENVHRGEGRGWFGRMEQLGVRKRRR